MNKIKEVEELSRRHRLEMAYHRATTQLKAGRGSPAFIKGLEFALEVLYDVGEKDLAALANAKAVRKNCKAVG